MDTIKITTENFGEFVRSTYRYNVLSLAPFYNIAGVKKVKYGSIGGIDALRDYPEVDVICLGGVDQKTFEYFILTYGKQLRTISLAGGSVRDLSPLGALPDLEFVYWSSNQHATSFWDMSKNYALKGLCLKEFSKLKCLSGIEKAPNLEWFEFGNTTWSTVVVDSYKYFAGTKVKHLAFSGRKIEDNDPSYLAQMPCLEELDLAWLYTTEQIAWIVANCPKVKGRSLQAVTEFMDIDPKTHENVPSVHVAGKGKRKMRIAGNEKKIQRCIDYFDRLVELYRGVPYEEAMRIPVK